MTQHNRIFVQQACGRGYFYLERNANRDFIFHRHNDFQGQRGMTGWRRSLAVYTDRRVLLILLLGFASGLPLLLTFSTLSAWLATAGVRRAAIGAFALVGTPYASKFVWSPLIDRLPPPLPLGRRRGWGISIQIALIAAILALGMCDPKHHLAFMGATGAARGVSLRQPGHRY